MASELGLKIDGRYEVVAEIGRGGMGVVYKALDAELDRPVAIKVMTSHVADHPEYVERFDTEARTAAKMQHPNIAVVHARGRHVQAPYIAMEYVEGLPLDKLIRSGAQLSLLIKIDYIIQVCIALHYAHSEWQVVHRDVKPANIMVTKDGHHIKLLDFGIARAGVSASTKSGMAWGTTFYMSPQQIKGEKGLDRRSDIFSAGVVLYELISGHVPWDGESDFQVLAKIVNDPCPPLSTHIQDYPAGLDWILRRALAKEVNGRYDTAQEMAAELAELQTPLKEQIVNDAQAARDSGDLLRANELASQVLRLDSRHGRALELFNELQPDLQQETERIRQLKTQAEQAVGRRDFDGAMQAITQAISLNPANAELHYLRRAIEQERVRKDFVDDRLRMAQTAKAANDWRAANTLVNEALEKDPADTEARKLKVMLARMGGKENKKKHLQALVIDVRTAVASRRFSDAFTGIKTIEELSPRFAELRALRALVAEQYAEEEKRQKVESVVRRVNNFLESGNVPEALSATAEALKQFPKNTALVKCRERAKTAQENKERREALEKLIAEAWELSRKKETDEALRRLEKAQEQYGRDGQLNIVVEQLRRIAEHQRLQRAEQDVLDRAREAMRIENFESAVQILRAARIDIPSSSEIKEALVVAEEGARRLEEAERQRQQKAIEALEALLANEPHPDLQVRIADDASQRNPGTERIQQIATAVRERQSQLVPLVERAVQLDGNSQYAEAAREWQRVLEIYPQYPQAAANIKRLDRLAGSAGSLAAAAQDGYDAFATRELTPISNDESDPLPDFSATSEGTLSVVHFIQRRRIALAISAAVLIAVMAVTVVRRDKAGRLNQNSVQPASGSVASAMPPAAEPQTGSVTVKTNQPADLLVDGKAFGKVSDKQKIDLPVGAHVLSLSSPMFKAARRRVNVTQGKNVLLRFRLIPAENKMANAPPSTEPIFPTAIAATPRGGGDSAAVETAPVKAPEIAVFKAVPEKIVAGQSATLVWLVQNADSVSIEPGIGRVNGDSLDLKPTKNTKYTLTANGPGGSQSTSLTLNVDPAPLSAATESTDVKAIRAQVAAYKDAYESLSADAIGQIRPLSKTERQDLLDTFKQFRALKVQYHCAESPSNPSFHRDTAQYLCSESTTFTEMNGKIRQGDGNGSNVMFTFKKNGTNWAIVDVKGLK